MVTEKEVKKMVEEHTADNLMNYIISATYARHSKMSEKDFLKEIGYDKTGKTEEQAVRYAKYNVLVQTTSQLLALKKEIVDMTNFLDICLCDGKGEEMIKGDKK